VCGQVGLGLEGGGQGVAEELTALPKQEGLAGVKDAAQRGLPGLRFELGGQVQGHLGDLTLQGRLRQQRRFQHFSSSS
jgi:hypothetical protein